MCRLCRGKVGTAAYWETDSLNPNFMEDVSVEEPMFGKAERLALHQLRILEWQAEKDGKAASIEIEPTSSINSRMPDKWVLTSGLNLYDWQRRCVETWFGEGGRGTIKVV